MKPLLFALLSLLLASCALLQPPATPTPDPGQRLFPAGDARTHEATALELTAWWSRFDDPQLTELVTRALDANDELAGARAREAAVAAEERIAQSALLPTIDLDGLAGRSKDLQRLPLPPLGTDKEVDLSAAWQLDLFGALRQAHDAARWSAAAETERRRGIAVTVASDTVATYVAYQAGLAHVDNLGKIIERQSAICDFTDGQAAVGLASRAESDTARSALAQLTARLAPLKAQQAVYAHHLAVLTGVRPEDFIEPKPSTARSFASLTDRPEILPAQLLLQRPDLRTAYAQVKAAAAQVGVAKAEFLPIFSLQLAGGRQWVTADSFSTSGDVYRLGAGAVMPIFNAGRLRAQLRGARASFTEAEDRYNQTLLTSLEDVDNASANLIAATDSREQWLEAERISGRAAQDATSLYAAGRVDARGRLLLEQQALAAEDGRVSADAALELSVVSIYRALGGGWGAGESSARPPQQAQIPESPRNSR